MYYIVRLAYNDQWSFIPKLHHNITLFCRQTEMPYDDNRTRQTIESD